MSERVMVASWGGHVGERIQSAGWVHVLRRVGGLSFLVLRERSGLGQVVVPRGVLPGEGVRPESVVEVEGVVAERPGGGVELQASAVRVLSPAEAGLPVPVGGREGAPAPGLSAELDHRAVALRAPQNLAPFRVQAELAAGFRAHLSGLGFTEIRTPKIVGAGAEGGAELFEVVYFEGRAFLAQSPQFYKQIMVGSGLERVFEVGPAFRAERHNSARHLNEFTSMDVEVGFVTELEELLALEEGLLGAMLARVEARCAGELAVLGRSLPRVGPVPRWTMAEAKERLARAGVENTGGADLSAAEERELCRLVEEETGQSAVFVTRYPAEVRPAYAMPSPGEAGEGLTESFDLLVAGCEVTTGGLRIHEAGLLAERLAGRGLRPEACAFYLEAFRYGMPPHGGFALGLERLTAQLLGLPNVRQACLFPRDRTRLAP